MLRVGHDVGGLLLAVRLFRAVLAEVHAADEFAHDDEVDAVCRDVSAQRAGGGELGEHLRRAHVRVEAHALAQLEQTALGTVGGGLIVPLRAADRTEQHAVRAAAGLKARIRQRHAEFVNGVAAHRRVDVGEGVAKLRGHGV